MQEPAAPALDLRWTLSNALSALRLVMIVPTGLALINDLRWLTVGLCILATITDVLDGYVARRNNEISDLGKILDPLADKVFVGGLVLVMLLQGMLPLWFVGVVLGRDILILIGGIIIERRTGVVLPSNYPGKLAVLLLSLTLLLIIIGIGDATRDILMGASLVMLAISIVLYGQRAAGAVKGKGI